MANRLPSLDALRFFDVTARYMSFTLAAAELCVSQSAVSQKIRLLEEQLGYPLFQRLTRSLTLTKKGLRLLPVVRRALLDIEAELEILADKSESFSLKIHTPASISSNWLIPRLADFGRRGANIDIELVVDILAKRFTNELHDVAIIHNPAGSQNEHYELLMADYIYPVATREVVQQYSLYNVSDLKNAPLLHDSARGGQLHTSWDAWFAKRKLRNQSTINSLSLNQANMIMSAAAEGAGVGLVRHCLAGPLVKSGVLIPLFNDIEADGGIYIESSHKAYQVPEIQAFWKWMVKQARVYNKAHAFSNLELFRAYETHSTQT
ncbi:LysR substrate-binding domain-containing protein [Reinekea sp.]|uniref:LysR substrate-binding domain-containing protein n=1 Tax=Reinekea sp. TaxID=1970455 RepID=UPI002A81635C|nr:LysR substrate-binding domain-containing protein [Reinekea sp.]